MLPIDLHDVSYLELGDEIAQGVLRAIRELELDALFHEIDPEVEWTIAGSLPLQLFIPSASDVDLIVSSAQTKSFSQGLADNLKRTLQASGAEVSVSTSLIMGVRTSLVQFQSYGFPFEVFVQSTPLAQQSAVRHLLIEARLLELGGPVFFDRVQELRKSGLKTEPAFAAALDVDAATELNPEGLDPYRFLLELEERPDSELKKLIAL